MFTTPILFLVFNRPDTTVRVFEQIRKIKPAYLYVAADGPRESKPGEKEICDKVRSLVLSQIDWECEIKTLLREENLGCGKAVSGAITWFFENVEEGIILEDDTVPDLSFFKFCEILLKRYAYAENVKIISGNNFQNDNIRGDGSYYFTKYIHIWGWATWRRSWNLYDFELQDWISRSAHAKRELFTSKKQYEYWSNIFDLVSKKEIDTWDYQLFYLSIKSNGINVIPNKNLVTNIGFMQDSTHTNDPNNKLAGLSKYEYSEDVIPLKFEADNEADSFTFNNVYTEGNTNPAKSKSNNLFYRIFKKPVRFLKDIIKRMGND